MKRIAGKAAVFLAIVLIAIVTAGFCACGNGQNGDQPENSGTIQTNPNDDGFGTEVGM